MSSSRRSMTKAPSDTGRDEPRVLTTCESISASPLIGSGQAVTTLHRWIGDATGSVVWSALTDPRHEIPAGEATVGPTRLTGESPDYVAARDALQRAEIDLIAPARAGGRAAPPAAGVIDKWESNAFAGTDLKDVLDRAGVDTAVIAGLQSEFCVAATCEGAT